MADKLRTLVRRYTGDELGSGELFELCIDEHRGCGLYHVHDYGHDFPMERDELLALRDQIDAVLATDAAREKASAE